MDQKKKDAIIGLLVGFVGLVVLFLYDYKHSFEYSPGVEFDYMESVVFQIGTSFSSSNLIYKQWDSANKFYFISLPVYLGLVWYYRACIGYWLFKIIKLVYKIRKPVYKIIKFVYKKI